ncbi:MAG: hypothetical protein HYV09_36100 [Deltaproteobacteria bacterium]|nr:hypothetical protein [Deltaproteobacteria bacterium]
MRARIDRARLSRPRPGYVTACRSPSGAGWRSIECPGSHQACIDKAAAICPNGYEIGTSGGATEVSGANGTVGSKYTGHMLVKCDDPVIYKNVRVAGCKFQIPTTWDEGQVDGSTVYHPHLSWSTQVFLEVNAHVGTLEAWAAKELADQKIEKTTLEDHPALLATRIDELNGLRISTVAALEGGRVYALTCASAPPEALSPACRRVLGSLRVGQDE